MAHEPENEELDPHVKEAVAHIATMPRMHAAEKERDKPEGCTLFCYEPVGKVHYWEAKLPPDVQYCPLDGIRETHSRHRNFGAIRSKEQALAECRGWLWAAKHDGAF